MEKWRKMSDFFIYCPHCGREFLPGEIFTRHHLGSLTVVHKNTKGRIVDSEGDPGSPFAVKDCKCGNSFWVKMAFYVEDPNYQPKLKTEKAEPKVSRGFKFNMSDEEYASYEKDAETSNRPIEVVLNLAYPKAPINAIYELLVSHGYDGSPSTLRAHIWKYNNKEGNNGKE